MIIYKHIYDLFRFVVCLREISVHVCINYIETLINMYTQKYAYKYQHTPALFLNCKFFSIFIKHLCYFLKTSSQFINRKSHDYFSLVSLIIVPSEPQVARLVHKENISCSLIAFVKRTQYTGPRYF